MSDKEQVIAQMHAGDGGAGEDDLRRARRANQQIASQGPGAPGPRRRAPERVQRRQEAEKRAAQAAADLASSRR